MGDLDRGIAITNLLMTILDALFRRIDAYTKSGSGKSAVVAYYVSVCLAHRLLPEGVFVIIGVFGFLFTRIPDRQL